MKKYIGIVFFAAVAFTGCTTVILVRSLWDNNNIVIDGIEKDWNDRTFYLNEQNLSLGVRNDQENFYLFVKVLDRQQMRTIRAAGLTVWLDPAGDDGKVYGIRIPGKPMRPGEMSGTDFESMPNDINEVEIFSKGVKEPLQVPVAQLKGIEFAASKTFESLIFEFKFPLKENSENPLRWNVPGEEIGVTLETGKIERPGTQRRKPEFGESQDDRTGAPTGMNDENEQSAGRRGGGRGEFKQHEKSSAIDFWFKVRLAEPSNKK